MNTFFLILKIKPSPKNEKHSDVNESDAFIFVNARSKEEAEERARQYIDAYMWVPGELTHIQKTDPKNIPELGLPELKGLGRRLYKKSQNRGIAAFFQIPKDDLPPGYREIRKP